MNCRERVLTAFKHKTPDRAPLDYCAVPEFDEMLIKRLTVKDRDELLKRLQVDFRHLDKWGTMVPKYTGPELPVYDDGITGDMWGCRRKQIEYKAGCFYSEWIDPPLANAMSVRDIEKHKWPEPGWLDFSDIQAYCTKNNEYCLVGGRGATFDSLCFFRGAEQAMLDIYDNPDIVEAVTQKIFEFQYEYNIRLLEAANGRLDILFFSEDMGGQSGLLVSKDVLKKYVFPKLRKYAELAHKNNAMAMLHSDGDISEIIPDLIDLGVDIINPVQNCGPDMEPEILKSKFGDELCFHGLLDSQNLMPFSTPDEVVREARRLIKVMGVDGGLALAPNCGFQTDVPPENVFALYDAVGTV